MADYLLVRNVDDYIIWRGDSTSSEAGCRLEDVNAQPITGDSVPSDRSKMVHGTLTSSYVYTKPSGPDLDERSRAWDEASVDWLDNGTMTDDERWKRCVKSGNKSLMTDTDWDDIIVAYP